MSRRSTLATVGLALGWWAVIAACAYAAPAWDERAEARVGGALLVATAAVALAVALAGHALGRLPRARGDGFALGATAALAWLFVPELGVVLYQKSGGVAHVAVLAALAWLLLAARLARSARARGAALAGVALVVVAALVALAGAPPRMPAHWRVLDAYAARLGMLVALVLVIALATIARARRVGGAAPALPAAESRRVLALTVAAIALAVTGVDRTMLLPTALALVAAVIVLGALAADAGVRRAVWIAAVVVQLVVVGVSLGTYARVHRDVQARRAWLLEAERTGSREAVLPVYHVAAGSFFAGEELLGAGVRARLAARHGLADILLAERVPGFEPASPYVLAGEPAGAVYVRDLPVARAQWRQRGATGALAVSGLEFPGRRERPVIAARPGLEPHARAVAPRLLGLASFRVGAPALDTYPEVLVVHDGALVPAERRGAEVSFRPTALGAHALVVCDARECVLVATMEVRPFAWGQ